MATEYTTEPTLNWNDQTVVFLDIDGVLNSLATAKRDGEYGIAQDLLQHLHKIINATNCDIVISSAWRVGDGWRARLLEAGLSVVIMDRTPRMHRPVGTGWEYKERGKEIQAWLDAHTGIKAYAIIDDDSDMLDSQLPSFFHTDHNVGLTEEIADKVIAHLLSTT